MPEQIIIDLSGQKGLGPNFFGDSDMITPQPNLRINPNGEMAQGLFNPYLRKGYMAPVTTTSTTLTLDNTITTQLASSIYDPVNNDSFFADRGRQIFTAGDLTDYTLTLAEQLDATDAILHDLEIYQVDDVRKLFFSYNSSEALGYVGMSTYFSSVSAVLTAVGIKPSGTSTPVFQGYDESYSSASGTTISDTVSISAGTDIVTVILAGCIGDTSGVSGITLGGNAMTFAGSFYTTAVGVRAAWYYYINPTPGSLAAVATFSGADINRFIISFTFTGAKQLLGVVEGMTAESSTSNHNLLAKVNTTVANELLLGVSFSDAGTHTAGSEQNVIIASALNTFITTAASTYDTSLTRARIGITDLPVANTDEKWLSENVTNSIRPVTTSNYNFIRNADNGFAYFFHDNKVDKIDGTATGGTNGTITKNVLLTPSEFRFTDAIDYRSNMYIVLHQYPVDTTTTTQNLFSGKCGIYVWNRISTQLTSSDYIEIPGVKEIKKIYASPEGILKIVAVSDSGLIEVRQFGYNDSGGVIFNTIKELGIGAFPQFVDGLQVVGDKTMWLANDGTLYCEKGGSISQLFQVKAPATTSANTLTNIYSGAILFGSGAETASTGFRSNKQGLVLSYLDSTTPYVIKVYPLDLTTGTNGAQTPNQGDVYTGIQFIPITSIVRSIRFYNAPVTGTGTDTVATVKVYFNQSTTVGMTKTITKDEARRGYVDLNINKPYIHAIQLEVEWATGISLGADTYLPSIAIITHENTSTKSPDNG